ncbi:MAG TPA: hypothetical protein PKM43_13595 [Verrucomicrobiota bacterium]|nr:hypothetical protein [Verrucomicrobiota bacterium]HRZ38600.1 hypothetical protein [Candidatus Paceibacterota bacterium]HRZ54876.1 hypothetical protein [Candidatus Paceibacterota bacterium]
MHPDHDHDSFAALRRAVALKRHEQPPPGYFDRLHRRVLDRLPLEPDVEPEDWFEALFERFRLRPALAGFFSFALGAFYLAGLGYSGRVAQQPQDAPARIEIASGFERRPFSAFEHRVTSALARDARPSRPSVTPVIPAGLSAPGLPLWHPSSGGNLNPVGYVVPSR